MEHYYICSKARERKAIVSKPRHYDAALNEAAAVIVEVSSRRGCKTTNLEVLRGSSSRSKRGRRLQLGKFAKQVMLGIRLCRLLGSPDDLKIAFH